MVIEWRTTALAVGEHGSPDEFAKAVACLASEEASYVSGALLPTDGGWFRGASC